MFVRRIASQLLQLQSLLLTVLGLREPTINSQGRADLVRDQFGLHKMIVAVTSVGKVSNVKYYFPGHQWSNPQVEQKSHSSLLIKICLCKCA